MVEGPLQNNRQPLRSNFPSQSKRTRSSSSKKWASHPRHSTTCLWWLKARSSSIWNSNWEMSSPNAMDWIFSINLSNLSRIILIHSNNSNNHKRRIGCRLTLFKPNRTCSTFPIQIKKDNRSRQEWNQVSKRPTQRNSSQSTSLNSNRMSSINSAIWMDKVVAHYIRSLASRRSN